MSRVFLLPFFVLGFFIEQRFGLWFSTIVFMFCCITDYLDGYYARAYKQTTKIGQVLDPLADKILISISILFITGYGLVDKVSIIPSSIILCREIIISGVRENADNFNTLKLSKWKTTAQMLAITAVLVAASSHIISIKIFGEIMLWISSVIAVISGLMYCRKHVSLDQEN
jgi:cardiolipin synthase